MSILDWFANMDSQALLNVWKWLLVARGWYAVFTGHVPDFNFGGSMRVEMMKKDGYVPEVFSSNNMEWKALNDMFADHTDMQLFAYVHACVVMIVTAWFLTNNHRESFLSMAFGLVVCAASIGARNTIAYHAIDWTLSIANKWMTFVTYITWFLHGMVWLWFLSTCRFETKSMAGIKRMLVELNRDVKNVNQGVQELEMREVKMLLEELLNRFMLFQAPQAAHNMQPQAPHNMQPPAAHNMQPQVLHNMQPPQPHYSTRQRKRNELKPDQPVWS